MKVQFIQNFSSMNRTRPRHKRKTLFSRNPNPYVGKRLRFSFW